MKRIFTYCLFALMAISTLLAQDVIITTDAQKIDAKILEVSKYKITYKESGYLEGPTFVLGVEDINTIIYGNGKVVLYNEPKSETKQNTSITQKEEPNIEFAQTESMEEKSFEQSNEPLNSTMSATVILRSGDTLNVNLLDMKSTHIVYMLDGKSQTIPESQLSKVILDNGQVKTYVETIDTSRAYRDWQGWLDYINILQAFDINEYTTIYLYPISYNSRYIDNRVLKSQSLTDFPTILKKQLQRDFCSLKVVIVDESCDIKLSEHELKLSVQLEKVEVENTTIRTMAVSGIVEGAGNKKLVDFRQKHLSGSGKTIDYYLKDEFGIFSKDISNMFSGLRKECKLNY